MRARGDWRGKRAVLTQNKVSVLKEPRLGGSSSSKVDLCIFGFVFATFF